MTPPFPGRTYGGKAELLFDICSAPRTGATSGRNVKKWYNFPHVGRFKPDGAQILLGDFSMEYRRKNDLTRGYKYNAPVDVFW